MNTPLSTMAWMSEGGPLRDEEVTEREWDEVTEREWLRSRAWIEFDRSEGT